MKRPRGGCPVWAVDIDSAVCLECFGQPSRGRDGVFQEFLMHCMGGSSDSTQSTYFLPLSRCASSRNCRAVSTAWVAVTMTASEKKIKPGFPITSPTDRIQQFVIMLTMGLEIEAKEKYRFLQRFHLALVRKMRQFWQC